MPPLELTRGHPCLVQLLCFEVIELKNHQPSELRQQVTCDDIEVAVPPALKRGAMLFADIEREQIDAGGIAVLRQLARSGEQVVVSREALRRGCRTVGELDRALSVLQQRELVEAIDGGFRVQVELIRRWFA